MSDLLDGAETGMFGFRLWSHTDKRHMLTLTTGPLDALDGVTGQVARLKRLSPENETLAAQSDVPRRERLLHLKRAGDFRFLAVSWSERAPIRLRVESVRMILEHDAFSWAEFMQDQKPKRVVYLMELVQTERPSPV